MSDQDDKSLLLQQANNTPQPANNAQPPATAHPDSISIDPLNIPSSNVNLPAEAADLDLIEKQWVVKAKEIVEHTSDNPYLQQQEIAKMKAEYIKKRYNKDIKL